MGNEYQSVTRMLNKIQSVQSIHDKFKHKYNSEIAFDFDLFQFFKFGENKISHVLAFFMDPKQTHGQGDIFLRKFIEAFCEREVSTGRVEITCEKPTLKNRRIDIYIRLDNFVIAIENKVWANDQRNQLADYSKFLENQTQGNYLLLYLTPYGTDPQSESIHEKTRKLLEEQGCLKLISYQSDLIPLIGTWVANCRADNVAYFLKAFKKKLETEILGQNTLSMSKELREIIHKNEIAVQQVVGEFRNMEKELVARLDRIGRKLDAALAVKDYSGKLIRKGLFK